MAKDQTFKPTDTDPAHQTGEDKGRIKKPQQTMRLQLKRTCRAVPRRRRTHASEPPEAPEVGASKAEPVDRSKPDRR
jgi:hypothetical protein